MVLCLLFSIGLCANFVPVRSRAANYVYATQRIVDVEAIRVAAATSGDDTQLAIRTEISGAYIYVSGGRANEGCPKIAKIRCVDGMFVNGVNIQMGELPNKNEKKSRDCAAAIRKCILPSKMAANSQFNISINFSKEQEWWFL